MPTAAAAHDDLPAKHRRLAEVLRGYGSALVCFSGGVGFYPHSQFVHGDTGPIRYWTGS